MHKRTLLTALVLVALAAVVVATATGAASGRASKRAASPVQVEVFAPRSGDVAGKQSKGFFVDLALRYPSLAASGASGRRGSRSAAPSTPRSWRPPRIA